MQFIIDLCDDAVNSAEHQFQEVTGELHGALMQGDRLDLALASARTNLEDAQRAQDVQRASCHALCCELEAAQLRCEAASAVLQTAGRCSGVAFADMGRPATDRQPAAQGADPSAGSHLFVCRRIHNCAFTL